MSNLAQESKKLVSLSECASGFRAAKHNANQVMSHVRP